MSDYTPDTLGKSPIPVREPQAKAPVTRSTEGKLIRQKGGLRDAKLMTTHKVKGPVLLCMRCLSRAPYYAGFCDHKTETKRTAFNSPHILKNSLRSSIVSSGWSHPKQ